MTKFIAFFALLIAFVAPAHAQDRAWPNNNCIGVGIYTSADMVRKQTELNTRFNHVLRFQPVQKLDHAALVKHLNAGYGVVLNIEFKENYANLKDIIAGKYDAQLRAFGEAARRDGRTIWIRPLHEGNGDWYNWGVFFNPTVTTGNYRVAFQKVVNVLRSTEGKFKFQFNLNRKNGKNKTTPLKEFYPGDSYVDMILLTNYNRAYTSPDHQFWKRFRDDFDSAYQQVTTMSRRPIGIAEMSSTSYGGDKPAWIRDTFKDIAERYPRILEVTWFAYNRPVGNMIWDWDFNTPQEKAAFAEGVARLRTPATCNNRRVYAD